MCKSAVFKMKQVKSKNRIEWPSNHRTIVVDLLILVGLLIQDDSVREASTGVDPASKFRGGGDFRNIW